MTLEHLPALEQIAFDERIWRYMMTWVKTPEDLRAWVEHALRLEAAGTVMPWVTVLKDGQPRDWKHAVHGLRQTNHVTTELGETWLAPEFHGAGLNAEAKLLQLTYAFEELRLRRVALKTHHENLQSQTGDAQDRARRRRGRFATTTSCRTARQRHSVWFSIIREDWPQVKSRLEARVGSDSTVRLSWPQAA